MKNSLTILFAAAALLLGGCKKFLEEDPQGIVIGEMALSNVNGLNAQMAGAYKSLAQPWDRGFADAAQFACAMGGDDLTSHPGLNKQDFREFDQFNVSALNARSNTIWRGLYKTIQSSNNIIGNYQNITGDETAINQIAGEAYFLRAFSYYYLVRWWGKVPLLTTATYSPDLLSVAKSEIVDVYAQIEADLKKAEELVGEAKLEPGRINKGTVKSYLADVYLTQTGYPVKDASKAALAAAKAKEVIDEKGAYGFDLFQGDFQKIFATAYNEYVFALMTDGTSTGNCYYGFSTMPGDEGGWDDYFAEINFFRDFPEGNRKNGTFTTVVNTENGLKTWQQLSTKHPYYKKFRIQTGDSMSYVSNSPIIFMRYAEVLLLYAEAQARSGAPNADAYAAINAVRQRAGLANLAASMSGDDFVKAVIQERAWEFAGEWHRWFDLVRTETVAEANAHRDPAEIPLIGDPGDKTKWLIPVPAGDANANPNL
ncbi:MAG: RagB/SusD family nutrient uptake outer membrane protein [Flavihumibacter sp.]